MKKLTHDEIASTRLSPDNLDGADRLPVQVLLDSIRSSYNVGSIFRTSDGAMIERLILTGYCPHPPNKEILKTALGATESVAWEYVKDPVSEILRLKEQGVKICALEQTDKSRLHYGLSNDDFPLCLLVGNEISGVSQDLIDLCDFSIEIPQFGVKQSLNVAVAYGISIFEMRRVYDQAKRPDF